MNLRLIALIILFASGPAAAGGIWLYDLGAPSAGRSAAGSVASAEDAVTAFSNPAGMTLLKETGFVAGINALYVTAEFDPGPATTNTGGGGGNAGGFSPGGGFYYANRHSDRTQWGVALNSWFGLGLDYDDDWAGRYFSQEADIFSVALTGTVSHRINDRFSIGGGLSALMGELTVITAVNNAADGLEDGTINLESDDVGVGFNIGLMYEVSDATRFGLTYRSEIDLELGDVLGGEDIGPTILAQLQQLGLQPGAKVDLADVGWQDWSEFGVIGITVKQDNPISLTTPTRYDDTWRIAVGMEYELQPGKWKLATGISYDSSPVKPAHRTPEFPVDQQIRLSVGLHRHTGKRFDWALSYTYVDSGTGRMNASLGDLTGRIQGDYSPYNVHALAFSLIGEFR